jgi:formate/nitrite transporter FocA (FNT family)
MKTSDDQAELNTPKLDEQENKQVEKRKGISVLVVHEAVRKQGDEELERPAAALWWSGIAAGLSMGSSLIVEGLLRAHLPDAGWRPLLQQFGYPFGFLMLVLGRQQLFTENTVTAIVPLLARRNWETFWKVAKLWAVVLSANLVGAHIAAWALSNTPAFNSEVKHAFDQISREAVAVGFGAAVVKGIVAGWLIAMMVWMLAAIEAGEVIVIILMTYVVGLGSLTHIVAGSIEALFLVWNGTISWWAYAGGYALPTLIGNILGGVSLVAVLNHAQVVAGHHSQAE